MSIQDCADTMSHPPFRHLERCEDPPPTLTDPDGEGVYICNEPHGFGTALGTLATAQRILGVPWAHIDTELVYFRPVRGADEWFPAPTGRRPRYWRLNLPRRWRPMAYTYCTPKPTC